MASRDQEIAFIKTTLEAGRRGGASVSRLAIAHELAEKHALHHTAAELRKILRKQIPDPTSGDHVWAAKNMMIGIFGGFLTHLLLATIARGKHSHLPRLNT